MELLIIVLKMKLVILRIIYFLLQFFLKDLDLDQINMVAIQMQNYLTEEMGETYSKMLKSYLGIESDQYWKGMVCSTDDFNDMDIPELARQVEAVRKRFSELGKAVMLLPKSFAEENLRAYVKADWKAMPEKYSKCMVPWLATDITSAGDIAPCHIFYDLTLGNLHDHSFEEVWNGEQAVKFREYMQKHGLMSICHGCCTLYIAGIRRNYKL